MFSIKKFKIVSLAVVIVLCLLVVVGNFFNFGIFSKNKINFKFVEKNINVIVIQNDFDSYLLEQLETYRDFLKEDFLKKKIKALPKVIDNSVVIFYENDKYLSEIKTEIKAFEVNFSEVVENNRIILTYRTDYINNLMNKINKKTIKIIKNRMDEVGIENYSIDITNNKISIRVGGSKNADELKNILKKPNKLSFYLADSKNNDDSDKKQLNDMIFVYKKQIIDGSLLENVKMVYGENNVPLINLKFNNVGKRKIAEITKDNIGKTIVMALDDRVISAVLIVRKINSGVINVGNARFTNKEIADSVKLLKLGTFVAPLIVINETAVDNNSTNTKTVINVIYTSIFVILLISIFTLLIYRSLGLFLNILFFINVIILIALLSIFNVEVMFSGFIGIILTLCLSLGTTLIILKKVENKGAKNNEALTLEIAKNVLNEFGNIVFNFCIVIIFIMLGIHSFKNDIIRNFAITTSMGIASLMVVNLIYLEEILSFFIKIINNGYKYEK